MLAYVTAVTHGLNEEADTIKHSIDSGINIEVQTGAKFMKPPVPIAQTVLNWPLLTIVKVSLY